MSREVPSDTAMLAALQDIHRPMEAPGGAGAELVAALALGGIAAIAGALALRLLVRFRSQPEPETLATTLDRLASAPEEVRRVALLHILKAQAPDRFAAVRAELYRPGSALSAAQLETEVRRHA